MNVGVSGLHAIYSFLCREKAYNKWCMSSFEPSEPAVGITRGLVDWFSRIHKCKNSKLHLFNFKLLKLNVLLWLKWEKVSVVRIQSSQGGV